jgi:hypothetical protein
MKTIIVTILSFVTFLSSENVLSQTKKKNDISIKVFKQRDNKIQEVSDYEFEDRVVICNSWGDILDRIELTGIYNDRINVKISDNSTNKVILEQSDITVSNLPRDVKFEKKKDLKSYIGKYTLHVYPFLTELGEYTVSINSNKETLLKFNVEIQECGG